MKHTEKAEKLCCEEQYYRQTKPTKIVIASSLGILMTMVLL